MSNTVPVSTLSKLMDCTERHVQKLAKDNIIPRASKGQYDLIGCVQSYVRYLRRKTSRGDLDDHDSYKLKIHKEQALKLELDNRERQGDLLPKVEVEKEVGNAFSNVRTRLLSIPNKAAPEVFGKESRAEIEAILKNLVYEALNELASCSYDIRDNN